MNASDQRARMAPTLTSKRIRLVLHCAVVRRRFSCTERRCAHRSVWRFCSLPAPPLLRANAQPQSQLSPEMQHKIDDLAAAALAKTGVPSASVAVVKDGQIAYLHAYGNARLDPQTAATPPMRYSIGSVSKQFTAASILLLQEEGKLSLDDKVGKFLPDLTRANDVTIREILSHTSGYQDYWPQDYVMPEMLQPTTARKILDVWARKPLDFEPGTKWQYSNTNYVIAGLIVEKASGQPLLQFLQQHIFTPLDMNSVADTDQAKLGDTDPSGYMRYALGPLRPAPKEGTGWLFAAGELAMPAEDLAKWDISIMSQSLLKPASYRDFETEVLLANGLGTRYGLGVDSPLGIRSSRARAQRRSFRLHLRKRCVSRTIASPSSCSPTKTLPTRPRPSPKVSPRSCSPATTPPLPKS